MNFLAMLWWFCIFQVISVGLSLQARFPIANTALGKIRGHYKYSYNKRIYSAFEGIPYAKPPVKNLRFREPQDVEPWTEILNTTTVFTCLQVLSSVEMGTEDCLYLNVYVPRIQSKPNKNLDVIVHIHSGAFVNGNTKLAGPKFLMDRDIVYVSLNYRVGILGFLSTGDNVLPGNYGLKDQVFALKWIRNNIRCFGGNPKSVTLTGISAGAASVHLHYFSSLSKGLFHRGVLQSGTALSPWTIQTNPLANAIKIGKSIGCPYSSSKKLTDCLKTKSSSTLCSQISTLYRIPSFPMVPIGPVIERPSRTAFLTEHPHTLLKSGKVANISLLCSITTDEGIIGLSLLNHTTDELEKHWNEYLPYVLDFYSQVPDAQKKIIAEKIWKFYLNDKKLTKKIFVKLFGDRLFVVPFEKSARMHANTTKSSIYAFVYGYKNSFPDYNVPKGNYDGVSHVEDGLLIYDTSFMGLKVQPDVLSTSDVLIKETLIDILISFAKDGVPKCSGVTWEPVTKNENFKYLLINNPNNITMQFARKLAPTEFWSSLRIN